MMMVLQDVQLVEQCVAQGNSSEDPSISVYNKAEANSYTHVYITKQKQTVTHVYITKQKQTVTPVYNKAEANSYTRI